MSGHDSQLATVSGHDNQLVLVAYLVAVVATEAGHADVRQVLLINNAACYVFAQSGGGTVRGV